MTKRFYTLVLFYLTLVIWTMRLSEIRLKINKSVNFSNSLLEF